MKLVGNYNSPFVRRVAVSANALSIPFELEPVLVSRQPDAARKFNPLVRIPALVLDDGEVLIDSTAILDELDQIAGPEKALVPVSRLVRRHVLKAAAVAMGTMEKTMWALYERRFRPPEVVHEPWIERNDAQVLGGLKYLDDLAEPVKDKGWIAGTERLSQADISAAVAFTFANLNRPNLKLENVAPALAAFASRCEELPIFRSVAMPMPTL